MQSVIENFKPNQHKRQGFCPSPPWTRKSPEDCFRSYIDQLPDGYSGSILVRNEPRKTTDSYFIVRTFKSEVRSHRRNKTHRSVALFRIKAGGAARANIEYLTCSFLELDGSTDSIIKTQGDVLALINKNNLPEPSYVIETSRGHFHIIWIYSRPLPWTTKGESYWLSVQKRYIELFKQGGFLVDKGASLNPCQNLRNPSQLRPFNFKRGCEVFIHSTYKKTSLRRLYKALNGTNIPNPKRVQAGTKLRRDWRTNKTLITTHKAYAKKHGVSERTIRRELQKAIQNGDLQIVRRTGNNKGIRRTTEYLSNLYIEPNSQNGHLSICKSNSVKETNLLTDFQANGAENGRRNRTVFVLAVGLSCESNQTLSVSEIANQLRGGSLRSGLSEKELVRTIKNAIKPVYSNPFSLQKMQEWGLLERRKTAVILH